jgi:hypothetical protein
MGHYTNGLRMKWLKFLLRSGIALLIGIAFSGCGGSSAPSPRRLSISTSTLPSGQTNTAYQAMLNATGGTPPYAWSAISGNLPVGLSLSSGGMISGTPVAQGTFTLDVQVADAEPRPQTATAQLSITIALLTMSITTNALPSGIANIPYTASLTATGGVAPYVWSISGGSLPPGLILSDRGSIAGIPTSAGTFPLVVQVADSGSSPQVATAQLNVTIGVGVITQHNDNSRTGQNLQESILTPSNVNAGTFGKRWSYSVDGDVYGQPLYVPNVAIPGKGIHNVLYVVTEHDSVYALDADSNAPPLWQTSFINPHDGITTVSDNDVNCLGAIDPEIGITSTPVIDTSTNTIYVLAATKEQGHFFHRLHALDISTGAEKFGGPVAIQATYPGAGDGSSGGTLTFASVQELNRAGLLLSNGKIYLAFASYCDNPPFHGWLMAYDKATLQQSGVWVATPNGEDGGIWMSGAGIAAEASGSIFFATGNGTFDTFGNPVDFGDSIVKMTLNGDSLIVNDYFTPSVQHILDQNDEDLGSGGVLLLPDQLGDHVHELVQAGKEGEIYVVDRDNMGHFNPNDSQIVQTIGGQLKSVFSAPAYWNNYVYFGSAYPAAAADSLKAFSLTNGLLSQTPTSASPTKFSYPGPTPVISANSTSNAILWALETSPGVPAVLHAYDATNLAHELYNSGQNPVRDNPGNAVKFAVPTVANGKVYVGAVRQVSTYGLLTPLGVAVYDSALGVPRCPVVFILCDSGLSLLAGKDHMAGGSEPNQPNTIHNSCADGTAGRFRVDESIDRLKVATTNGGLLKRGAVVQVSATVWVADPSQDALDFYYATDANNPHWVYISTVVPRVQGAQTLSAVYWLQAGNLQAVRASLRKGGTSSPCSTGSYDDHDDLVFAVQ